MSAIMDSYLKSGGQRQIEESKWPKTADEHLEIYYRLKGIEW